MNVDTSLPGCSLVVRSERSNRSARMLLLGVIAVALAARLAALGIWSENLSDDRDIYLALAEGVAAGRGFSVPGTEIPTAFRPPLYPLLLVATGGNASAAARAMLHLLLGIATVCVTFVLGRRLGLNGPVAVFAAALVAVDPLLVRYTTFPMTETLVTFLTTALLCLLAGKPSRQRQLGSGLLVGLGVLSRPTLWAFGGLMLLRWVTVRLLSRFHQSSTQNEPPRLPWVTLAVLTVTVSPWLVRNMLVMGHPIVMTTHGGYTLLLGNNTAFWREVVDQPWGTVWNGSVGGGQAEWAEQLNREMDDLGLTDEVARDQWLGARARTHIRDEPLAFLKACWLRFRRFWALTPGGGDAKSLPAPLQWPLAAFYGTVYVLAAIGLYRAVRFDLRTWAPAILMVVAFVTVHLVYWSNARMRAPVIPVVALVASRAFQREENTHKT